MAVDYHQHQAVRPLPTGLLALAKISGSNLVLPTPVCFSATLGAAAVTLDSIISAIMEHTFTLRLQLPDDNWDHDHLAERLGAAGCGDALIEVGRPGHIAHEFLRDAGSMSEAIEAARAEVMAAIPAALLIG